MKRVAIIGTQGVPAAYGGFETLVENMIGENCPADVEYTVFCSRSECEANLKKNDGHGNVSNFDAKLPKEYKGARLKYVPLQSHGIQSIPYDILSMLRTLHGYDVVVVLGTSGCSFLPIYCLLRRGRLIVNIDGLEHRRDKWGKWARRLLLFSEKMAVRHAHVIVADNQGIVDYVEQTYGINPSLIAYGGDHAVRTPDAVAITKALERYGVAPRSYAVSVCRIEPENNCHLILEAFARQRQMPIIYVGNWDRSDYGRQLKEKYADMPWIKISDPEYDLDTLWALRSNAALYVHGHSAGGTNPSLVEAMWAARPIAAFDCVYNRATTHDAARYFASADDLLEILLSPPPQEEGDKMLSLAREHYRWSTIAAQYSALY